MSGKAVGGTVGGVGGAAVGTYFGGPIGGAVGGVVGSKLGSAIGGLFGGSDSPISDQLRANMDADQAATRGLSSQFLQAYNNAGRASAPTMSAASVGPIERANAPIVGATRVGAAPTLSAAQQGPAATVERTMVTPAAQAQGAQLGPAQLQSQTAVRNASTVDPTQFRLGPAQVAGAAQTGPAALARAATVDTGRSDQFRTGQLGLVSNLQNVISGEGPSVAREQLRQATDANIAATRGNAVAASRGGNTALAMREMLRQQGNLNQQAAQQGALVRAQEIATARGQMGDVLSGGRGQDIGIEQTNAANQQATELANAGARNQLAATNAQLGTQANLASMQALNQQSAQDAQLRLAASQGNQQAQNAVNTQQAALDAQQAAANADRLNARDTTQAQMDLQNRQFNAGAQNTVGAQQAAINAAAAQQNAVAQNAVAGNNAGYQQQANVQNAANQLAIVQQAANIEAQRQAQQAALTSTTNLANAGAQNAALTTNAGFQQQAGANNQNAAITTNAQNIEDRSATGQLALGGQKEVDANNKTLAGIEQTGKAADAAQDASTMNTVMHVADIAGKYYGTGGGGTSGTTGPGKDDALPMGYTTSDRGAKKNVREAGDREFEGLFAAIKKPVSWEYKNPEGPGSGRAPGRQYGVMAQDLERGGPIGKSLVFDDGGTKKIDSPQAIGVVMAMGKHLNDRLRRLEGRR